MVTIRDVAKRAGVSVPTVSRVLNNRSVGPDTKAEVLRVIELLNYKPNYSAVALGMGKRLATKGTTGNIAFLSALPETAFSKDFWASILLGIQEEGQLTGYDTIFFSMFRNEPMEQSSTLSKIIPKVDGLIIDRLFHPKINLIKEEVPVVGLNYFSREIEIPWILPDNRKGIYRAVRYLHELGHRRIGFVSLVTGFHFSQRLEGYEIAMKELGLEISKGWIQYGTGDVLDDDVRIDNQLPDMKPTVEALLGTAPPPTAVVVGNDIQAVRLMNAVKASGLSVPADISIIGFDDIQICEQSYPPLTTLRVPCEEMGKTAVRKLHEKITMKESVEPVTILLDVPLIIRGTCEKILSMRKET